MCTRASGWAPSRAPSRTPWLCALRSPALSDGLQKSNPRRRFKSICWWPGSPRLGRRAEVTGIGQRDWGGPAPRRVLHLPQCPWRLTAASGQVGAALAQFQCDSAGVPTPLSGGRGPTCLLSGWPGHRTWWGLQSLQAAGRWCGSWGRAPAALGPG